MTTNKTKLDFFAKVEKTVKENIKLLNYTLEFRTVNFYLWFFINPFNKRF